MILSERIAVELLDHISSTIEETDDEAYIDELQELFDILVDATIPAGTLHIYLEN